jgi:hypothetical protein
METTERFTADMMRLGAADEELKGLEIKALELGKRIEEIKRVKIMRDGSIVMANDPRAIVYHGKY